MRHLFRQNVLKLGMLVGLSGAVAGCGTAMEEGEAVGSASAALVSLPTPRLFVCGGANYSSRVSMYLAPDDDVCLRWTNLELSSSATVVSSSSTSTTGGGAANPCPSGDCQYTVYLRANGQTTVVADRVQPLPSEDPQLFAPLRIAGGSRLEYWVVASDVADPSVTSPPSNTIVANRCGQLHPDEYIFADNPIYSCSETYRLYPQADGNLVYSKYESATGGYTTAIWSTGPKSGANRLYMQADGNLVYSAQPANVAKWTTRTNSTPTRDNSGAKLVTTVNRFDVRKGQSILWRSDTGRTY